MIGQIDLLKDLTRLIDEDRFPRFSTFVGQVSSGKKKLAISVIPKLFKFNVLLYTLPDVKIDTIREMISQAYIISQPTIYIIPDADTMSLPAKNALLKVTEEPPKNAYFIMTLQDINNTLATIRSRSTIFYMNPYSIDEIIEYYKKHFTYKDSEAQIIKDICSTPGEVNNLISMGSDEFYKFVCKVIDNIAIVSGSNSFKIGNSIKMKESETDKYDLRLFWKAFMLECSSRLMTDPIHYADGIKITSKYFQQLRTLIINKQSLFDCWLLELRKVWM